MQFIWLDLSHIPLSLVADAVEEVAASAGDTFAAAASADAVASVAAAAFDAASAVVADPDILAAVDMLVVVVGNAVAGAVAHNHYQTAASPSVAAAASIAKNYLVFQLTGHDHNSN